MDIEQTAVSMRNAIKDIPKRFEYNSDRIKTLESEQIDLLHLAELVDLNAYDGFKFYKEIQSLQRERRILKDENDQLKHLYPILKGLKNHVSQFEKSIGDIRKSKKHQSKRRYRCRTRTDLEKIINGVK